MAGKRGNRLKEDLQAVVDFLQTSLDDEAVSTTPRFVLTELEDLAVRFLYVGNDEIGAAVGAAFDGAIAAEDGAIAEYTLSCCREEYPGNTIVTCSLEPNQMKIVDHDLLSVVNELRDLAMTTGVPPLPSMLGALHGRRKSDVPLSSTPEELFRVKKKRSSSHPEKLTGEWNSGGYGV